MRPLNRTIVLAGALFAVVAGPAPAAGPTSEQKAAYEVYKDYGRDGVINPCDYTTEQLELALETVRTDTRQYGTDFPRAVRAAIASRARGACEAPTATPTPSPAPTVAAVVPPAPPPSSGGVKVPAPTAAPMRTVVPEPPAPIVAATTPQAPLETVALDRAAAATPGNDAPAPLIGLGVLSALVLLGAAMLSALRRLGRPAGVLASQHHSWREAQWRAGGVWEDFRDFLRLGR